MATDRNRIIGPYSDTPMVVIDDRKGRKGELLTLDEIDFELARHWHYKLSEQHEPHFWQAYGGPRTGWNSVAGLFESSDLQQAEAAERRTVAALS
jgi:hypothetical protein